MSVNGLRAVRKFGEGTPALRGLATTRLEASAGDPMKLRLRVTWADQVRIFDFDRTPVRIGRDPSNECRIDFPFVSRLHAQIAVQRGRLMLRDEGSRQGTGFQRGHRQVEPHRFVELAAIGDEFQIGAVNFRLERRAIDEREAETGAALRGNTLPLARPAPPVGKAEGADWRAVLEALDPDDIVRSLGMRRWSTMRHRALWGEFLRRYAQLVHHGPNPNAPPKP
jgi:hypothetical protein